MKTHLLKAGVLGAAMVAASAVVLAQTPPAQANPAPQPGASAVPATAPTPAEAYTYNQNGRRDPFVSLVARGVEPTTGRRTAGLSGLSADELSVRGVLLSQGAYIALVSGPDGKTFTARANDRLADGVIRSITPQGLVIMQEVNDPLSLIKQREIRKGLKASDDGKQ